jgi:hypothetical protein
MNALQFIADYNENFGSPGVVRTMQVLTEQFDRLTANEKMLYAEFLEEIAVVLQNNKQS